ncbi:MAG: hypothetical protein RL653_2986 [Pseudomonadota bacterium]|jgi:hypothetical protein
MALVLAAACGVKGPPRPPRAAAASVDPPAKAEGAPDAGCASGCRESP